MSRAPLILSVVVMAVFGPATAGSRNPHLDPASVTGGCAACHQGHGAPRSPMLPGSQKQLCLSCHGSMAENGRRTAEGSLAPSARPALLGAMTAKLYAHPIDADATGAGANVVTCTSCHSPHRGTRNERLDSHEAKRSPRDPSEAEFELCEGCHGMEGGRRTLIARKLDPNNRSFHPVEAPAPDRAHSVSPALSGGRIACTDCHGNDDRQGPRGPHASNVPFILNADYRQSDGPESEQAFALCYGCHDRKQVLEAEPHATHVGIRGAACRTCHDGHGSVANRALVHIGEDESLQQVLPSLSAGRLAFVSDRAGTGECYLTCHGVDHAPKSYGTQSVMADVPPVGGPPIPAAAPMSPSGPRPTLIDRLEREPKPRERRP